MVNAWSLLYDEIYGDDEMSPCNTDHVYYDSDRDLAVGLSTASADTANVFSVDTTGIENISINTDERIPIYSARTNICYRRSSTRSATWG